jgi:hypothetical protein
MPVETPPVLFVSARYANRHGSELARHIKAGGVVAVLDLTRRRVREWRSQERPACIAAMADDLAGVWQIKHGEDSEKTRRSWAAARSGDPLSDHPQAVRSRRRRAWQRAELEPFATREREASR